MTPEYILLTTVTDINRLTHLPIIFQAFVHITATDTPLREASHTAEPKSQERGNAIILCGRWTCSSPAGSGNPDRRRCPPRSHPRPFLSVLVLTPVQPRPYTFRGFPLFFQLPRTLFLALVYSDSNFETRLDGQLWQTAPPPQGWLPRVSATPALLPPNRTKASALCPRPPAACLPPSCLTYDCDC